MTDISFICQEDIALVPHEGTLWEISAVATTDDKPQKTAFQERLAELMKSKGISARGLSTLIGANAAYVGQLLSGKGGTPGADRLRLLAENLGTTTDYLSGLVADPEPVRSEVSILEPPSAWDNRPTDQPGIPLLGTGYCDDLAVQEDDDTFEVERVMLELDHVIRIIRRPPALWNAPDAYAIYFHGSSMEPRYFQGEIAIVDPRRPPSPGDFVVAQLGNGHDSEVVTVLVKQLVRVAGGFVELRQFNPEKTFRIERTKVRRMHRIVSNNELYGA